MSIGYGETRQIDVPGYTRKIFHVSDVILNIESEITQETIHGNSFLYFINDWQYGHVLQDVVAHYEFLRQSVPDLQLIILSQNEIDPKTGQVATRSPVINNIFDKYPDCIFVNDRDKILIKNIYYFFSLFMGQVVNVLETNDPIFGTDDPDFHYQVWAANFIKEKFKPINPVKPTRKLYISRRIADKTYEKPYLEYYKKLRVLENVELLENYLKSFGYEIVTTEGLNIEDQAKLYQSASHIVTINGTGAYNTIFCDPGTVIFFLEIHTEFNWFFDYLTHALTSNYINMLPNITTSAKSHRIVVEQLIECLKNYEDIL